MQLLASAAGGVSGAALPAEWMGRATRALW